MPSFHWLVVYPVDIILGEGVTCLQIFKWRKLAIDFHKNTTYLNELMRYVESTHSYEIWLEGVRDKVHASRDLKIRRRLISTTAAVTFGDWGAVTVVKRRES